MEINEESKIKNTIKTLSKNRIPERKRLWENISRL